MTRFCDKDKHGYLIVFGTGRLLGKTDAKNTSTQSIYGIWDWSAHWEKIGHSQFEKNPRDKYLGTFTRGVNGVRRLSHLAHLDYLNENLGTATLLEQRLVHTDNEAHRVLSDKKPTWFSPKAPAGPCHLGWYMDLPQRGEKMIQNTLIRNKNLMFITHIPATSPCSDDSQSFFMEINACTGGRTRSIHLDVSGDHRINTFDRVMVDDPDSPGDRILVPVSGLRFEGSIYLPAIITLEKNARERNYFSTSRGEITSLDETAEKLGHYYWKEVQ